MNGTFAVFREVKCSQRASLLEITVEQSVMVEQPPPSKMLEQDETLKSTYCEQVLKLHEKLHGHGGERRRLTERRDAGVPRMAA